MSITDFTTELSGKVDAAIARRRFRLGGLDFRHSDAAGIQACFPDFGLRRSGGRGAKPPRACGHIAIYHSAAYVFIIAMPLQPSLRLSPESSVVISYYYGNGAGKHRFRLSPE